MKRKKKNKIELIICSTISLIIMLLIYVSFSWSSYTKLSQLKEIRISGSSIISDKEYSSKLEPLKGVELEEINLREVSILLESHPYVKAARVSRQYPSTLSVEIVERQPVAMLNIDPILMLDRDGIILPDLPLDEGTFFCEKAKSVNISPILLVAPNTSNERINLISKLSQDLIYAVSILGITGGDMSSKENLKKY